MLISSNLASSASVLAKISSAWTYLFRAIIFLFNHEHVLKNHEQSYLGALWVAVLTALGAGGWNCHRLSTGVTRLHGAAVLSLLWSYSFHYQARRLASLHFLPGQLPVHLVGVKGGALHPQLPGLFLRLFQVAWPAFTSCGDNDLY